MNIVNEGTGSGCWKLVIEKEGVDRVKVSIKGPRDGEKAWVIIPSEDLQNAVLKELNS